MMDVNAWGDSVGLTGLLSIAIMLSGVIGLALYLYTLMLLSALLTRVLGPGNAGSRWLDRRLGSWSS